MAVPSDVASSVAIRIFSFWMFVTIVAAAVAPRGLPWVVYGGLAIVAGAYLAEGHRLRPDGDGLGADLVRRGWPFLLMLAWAVVAIVWAADRSRAGAAAVNTALALASALIVADRVGRLDRRDTALVVYWMVAGFAVATIYLTFEWSTGMGGRRVANLMLGRLSTAAGATSPAAGNVALEGYALNRSAAVLAVLVWPMLWGVSLLWEKRRVAVTTGLLGGLTVLAVFVLEHKTSRVALLVGALVWAAARWFPRPTRNTILAGWCLVVASIVPLALLGERLELFNARNVPTSAQARVLIWSTAGKLFERHPWKGIGPASTPAIAERDRSTIAGGRIEGATSTHVHSRLDLHQHNVYLQMWFELGAVGGLLFLVCGVHLLRGLDALPAPGRYFALAAFMTVATINFAAWSIWQAWLLALLALLAIAIALAARAAEHVAEAAGALRPLIAHDLWEAPRVARRLAVLGWQRVGSRG